ncbi:hypothetical protein NL676_034586, partial [Syzygium grande]
VGEVEPGEVEPRRRLGEVGLAGLGPLMGHGSALFLAWRKEKWSMRHARSKYLLMAEG